MIATAEARANSYIFPQGALWAAMPLRSNAVTRKSPVNQVKERATFEIFDFILF